MTGKACRKLVPGEFIKADVVSVVSKVVVNEVCGRAHSSLRRGVCWSCW